MSTTPQVKPLQAYTKDPEGTTVIPASRRPDGSMRKPIRVKEGYVPQEEIPVYQSKSQRTVQFSGPDTSVPVGYNPIVSDTPKEPSKMALKRARAKAAKKAKEEAEGGVAKAADQLSKINLGGKK